MCRRNRAQIIVPASVKPFRNRDLCPVVLERIVMTSNDKQSLWWRVLRITGYGALALFVLNLAMPIVFFSPEIRARVITPGGKPIAGAIVAANWHVTDWARDSLAQLEIEEVVADDDGWFRIPRWGPRFIWYGRLLESEPTVRVFAPGFVPLVVRNTRPGQIPKTAGSIIGFRMQDQDLILQPFIGSVLEYENELAPIRYSLDSIVIPASGKDVCLTDDMPRLLNALQKVKEALEREVAGASITPMSTYLASCATNARRQK